MVSLSSPTEISSDLSYDEALEMLLDGSECETEAQRECAYIHILVILLLSSDQTMPTNAVCLDVYTARCLYLNSMRLMFWTVGLPQNLWCHADMRLISQDYCN